jgi:hypothetical protein
MTAEHNGSLRVEDEIDAALKMLGETEPPAAIVSRAHQRLEIAATSRRARSSRRLLIPAAGFAMATLAIFAIFIQTQRTQQLPASATQTARLASSSTLAQAMVTPPSAAVETVRADEGKRLVQYYTKPRTRQSRENRHANNILSYPLTREEKLLLEFAHNAKPADLQALNPEYQAKLEAQQDAEFAAYLKSGSSSDTEGTTQTRESNEE